MPKFTLDGKEIEFTQGQTIIEAAKQHGIDIPHFCWHPSLSVSGNCRMCLVEVEKMPKLVIACSTIAAEGMVVYSQSQKTIEARNAVMEFFLINHPLDCPICDEAGECKLQDYAYQHSVGESRFVDEKNHKDKRIPLGPLVMFDAERCISCSRCIRFCDEIAKDPELTFIKRGDRVTIVTYPGEEMDNPYSLNTTDICPVGALTNRDFRFHARVWDMSSTKSICIGCSRGCNSEIWVRNNEVLRLTPRHNEDVNSYWMCDHGRVNTYKFINGKDRVDAPYIRKEGGLVNADWSEALNQTAVKLKSFRKEEIAFIASANATCEDNYVFKKFAQSFIGSNHLDFMQHSDPNFGDNILRKDDLTPNTLGCELLGISPSKSGLNFEGIINGIKQKKIKTVYLIEDDLISANPELEDIFAELDLFIVHSTNFNRTTSLADIVLPAATYVEKNGTFVNFQGRVQRIRPAVATIDVGRAVDGLSLSRLDKFGTNYDRWAEKNKRDAKATWKILTSLSTFFDNKLKYNHAEDVFNEISRSIKAFNKLDYDIIGEKGVLLQNINKEQPIKV
jgi:NADH-quinone oxidoreductase subunit G